MRAATTDRPRAGVMRFCGDGCHGGYMCDVVYGLAIAPARARRNGYRNDHGCCDYCGAIVPTNVERRAAIANERGDMSTYREYMELHYGDLLDRARDAQRAGVEIDDDLARAFAAHWHSGQGSAFYSFASTGTYDRAALLRELSDTIATDYATVPAGARIALDMLGTYFVNREDDAAA